MTPEQIREIKRATWAAIQAGYRVQPRETLNIQARTCCPLGAVVLQTDPDFDPASNTARITAVQLAKHRLGLNWAEAVAFCMGFDGSDCPNWQDEYKQAWQVGVDLRKLVEETKPTGYMENAIPIQLGPVNTPKVIETIAEWPAEWPSDEEP